MLKKAKANAKVPKWLRIFIPSVLIITWLTAGAIGGPYFGKIEEVSENNFAAFLPPSAEATKAARATRSF